MRILKINKNDAGQRLDKFLSKAVKGLPMSLMYKLIRTKKIKVNRARTEQSFLVPAEEIVKNDYDLSINKYKEIDRRYRGQHTTTSTSESVTPA